MTGKTDDKSDTDDQSHRKSLDYRAAGVDIAAGNALVDKLKDITRATHRKGVLGGIGGFGALFELPWDRYRQPVLVSSTDGVGTKLKSAQMLDNHQTIGIDLVAMCVNDIIVTGAEPLFFLDYFATGKLSPQHAANIIAGIANGCKQANAALVGGETAEMPGMYHGDDYDLAGFCVGIVEKNNIIDGANIQPDNKLIALASSGPHSNGYSLIRKILSLTENTNALNQIIAGRSIGELLLEPTRIYVKSVLELLKTTPILGMAHITGGGITENLPRVLPAHVCAYIDKNSWQLPPIFAWLQSQGNITETEMLRTFNCGVGMILCVAASDVKPALQRLTELGETAWEIGHIQQSTNEEATVVYSA